MMDCAGGFEPPSTELKASVLADSVSVGPCATVNVTGIEAGEPWAPAAVIVIAALCVPTASEPVATVIVRSAGADPEPGATVSHGWFEAAVKMRVPPPAFDTAICCAGGFGPL